MQVINKNIEDLEKKIIILESEKELLIQEINKLNQDSDCKKILDYSANWEYWIDQNKVLRWMSPICLDITGYSREEFYENKDLLINIICDDDKSIFLEHLNRHSIDIKNDVIDMFQFKIKTKNGDIKYIEHICRPIFNHNNQYIGRRAGNRDISLWQITKEKMLESQKNAEKAAKVAHTILDNMGHELRTPLNGIIGFSRILKDYTDDEDIKEMAIAIDTSAERLRNTINSLLLLNEVEQNKYIFSIDNCNVSEVVDLYFRTTENLINSNNLYLKKEIIDNELNIKADEFLLVQILYQLLDNSLKFTRDGGITVKVQKEIISNKKYAVIAIEDTGCGIPKDKFEIIFEPFRQADEGINRHYEGLGLGLTIVKKLITILKGHIKIESELNMGTKFYLYFEANNLEHNLENE